MANIVNSCHILLNLRLNMKVTHFLKLTEKFITHMKVYMYPPREAEKGHSAYLPQTTLTTSLSILYREVIVFACGWK